MNATNKGYTTPNLISRFRETPGAHNAFQNKESLLNEIRWKSLECERTNHCETTPTCSDTYVALPDSYLELSNPEFDCASPVPVSNIYIQQGQQNLELNKLIGAPGVQESSEDILQEWRSKRKHDILNYTLQKDSSRIQQSNPILDNRVAHINEYNTARNRKQEYYEQLTNKYLHKDKPSACNPITHCYTSSSISPYRTKALNSPNTVCAEVNTDVSLTRDKPAQLSQSTSSTGLVFSEEVPMKEESHVTKIDAETNTYDPPITHIVQQTTPTVKLVTSQSVQTADSSEVSIQTVPLPSPPTKDTGPIPADNTQDLEDSLWSVSSMTSESVIECTERKAEDHSVPEGNGDLEIFKDDELVKLLMEKAQFYEQHIQNINKILNNFN